MIVDILNNIDGRIETIRTKINNLHKADDAVVALFKVFGSSIQTSSVNGEIEKYKTVIAELQDLKKWIIDNNKDK